MAILMVHLLLTAQSVYILEANKMLERKRKFIVNCIQFDIGAFQSIGVGKFIRIDVI